MDKKESQEEGKGGRGILQFIKIKGQKHGCKKKHKTYNSHAGTTSKVCRIRSVAPIPVLGPEEFQTVVIYPMWWASPVCNLQYLTAASSFFSLVWGATGQVQQQCCNLPAGAAS